MSNRTGNKASALMDKVGVGELASINKKKNLVDRGC